MKNLIFLTIVAIGFLSCATGYKPTGFTGGFSDIMLDENIFKVSFKGNAYTSQERATDFTLLRCAELALEHGYSYFIIVDSSEYSVEGSYTTPTTSTTDASVSSYGNTAYGSATTTTYGGQTYHYSKSRTTNTIICFSEKPDLDGLIYNASFIRKSISEKYNIEY